MTTRATNSGSREQHSGKQMEIPSEEVLSMRKEVSDEDVVLDAEVSLVSRTRRRRRRRTSSSNHDHQTTTATTMTTRTARWGTPPRSLLLVALHCLLATTALVSGLQQPRRTVSGVVAGASSLVSSRYIFRFRTIVGSSIILPRTLLLASSSSSNDGGSGGGGSGGGDSPGDGGGPSSSSRSGDRGHRRRPPPGKGRRRGGPKREQKYQLNAGAGHGFHRPLPRHRLQAHQQQQQETKQGEDQGINGKKDDATMKELLERVTQLEQIVSKQAVEIKRLKEETDDLTHAAAAFARVVELLREAGLRTDEDDDDEQASSPDILNADDTPTRRPKYTMSSRDLRDDDDDDWEDEAESASGSRGGATGEVVESFDDVMIFGKTPSSVIEAADAAGAAILAGLLGGQQRMLVDVRDADLSRDPELFVQFIELAVLPVAAGLEGLNTPRNRLKIVFPTVLQLLDYRRTMALTAPEVVTLSTLGFDPIEPKDNLIVIIAPDPNDEEGLRAMNQLLGESSSSSSSSSVGNDVMGVIGERQRIRQPVVVINHHMVPICEPAASYEVAYHLRLLTVQYMAADAARDFHKNNNNTHDSATLGGVAKISDRIPEQEPNREDESNNNSSINDDHVRARQRRELDDAMDHARRVGAHHGTTRAMVIRSFPNPWHVFVDVSPSTDVDYEVAATFDTRPSLHDVNQAIVECLEGSEQEDEIVAQQMQMALEDGQLDRVSKLLGSMGLDLSVDDDDDDDEEDEDDDWNLFGSDSV